MPWNWWIGAAARSVTAKSTQWLLDEVLKELRTLDHPRVRKLVTYLEGQQAEMLTFLDWLEIKLHPWQRQLAQHCPG